ncbi:MAG: hypothetical protein AB2A00_05085 [Myxococcota bacterium]
MLIAWTSYAQAAPPALGNVRVSDVTPSAFSVIFTTDQRITPELRIFLDDRGLASAGSAQVDVMPLPDILQEPARTAGVWKLRVTGLSPTTTYYYQLRATSDATGSVSILPQNPPYLSATTETRIERVQTADNTRAPTKSPFLLHDSAARGTPAPAGAVVLADVEGGAAPVSVYVGDGSRGGVAGVDLSNVFSSQTHESLRINGGETVRLQTIAAHDDVRTRAWKLPAVVDGVATTLEPFSQQVTLNPGWNLVAFQVEPSDRSVETVFAAAAPDVTEVWTQVNGQWVYRDLVANTGTLTTINVNQGYFVLATAPATITVEGGWAVDEIRLLPGWNIVGYRDLDSRLVQDIVDPMTGSVRAVWGYDEATQTWRCYKPGVPAEVNDLGSIEPGRAYYVYMSTERGW